MTAGSTVYSDVRRCPYGRLERTPLRRADELRQDHPSGIPERSHGERIRSDEGQDHYSKVNGCI